MLPISELALLFEGALYLSLYLCTSFNSLLKSGGSMGDERYTLKI